MPRQPRSQLPDGTFHVTTRGAGGASIFRDDLDRHAFLDLLDDSTARVEWVRHVYCLMDTHYHLLVTAIRANLSEGIHRLNGFYAQRFNRRHDRYGHLFEGRFSAYVIGDEDHFCQAVDYIRNNPVEAGLCATADDWPWTHVELDRLPAVPTRYV